MPEIAEVARIVHFLRNNLKGRRIAKITTTEDDIVYGKVGTSAGAFQKALTGRTVVNAHQQGKYFWIEMDKPPHPLLHFGMTGWLKLSNIETGYYRSKAEEKQDKSGKAGDAPEAVYNNSGSTTDNVTDWPPKFYKFILHMEGDPRIEAAFVDPRRLGRIRLVDALAADMRQTTPLKENGPDPIIDKDILTVDWLIAKLHSKKSPVKAVLLDQANISGLGNWVCDEILHNACIHPEQYSNTLSDEQCRQLHESMMFVCDTACGLLGDNDQYPSDWLFKYRWNKGKKDVNVMPNGEKIMHLTVGGRTSAIVPSRQKKTGPVAGDVKPEATSGDEAKPLKTKVKGKAAEDVPIEDDAVKTRPKGKAAKDKSTQGDAIKPEPKKTSAARKRKMEETDAAGVEEPNEKETRVNGTDSIASSRRRSARLSK